MTIAFKYADDNGLLLLDLKDLQSLMMYVGQSADELTLKYGNVSAASVGARMGSAGVSGWTWRFPLPPLAPSSFARSGFAWIAQSPFGPAGAAHGSPFLFRSRHRFAVIKFAWLR